MTALLERAFAQIRQLSEAEQDAVAARLLQTLAEVRAERAGVPHGPRPQFGSAKGKIWMAPDFDEPLEDFKDYM